MGAFFRALLALFRRPEPPIGATPAPLRPDPSQAPAPADPMASSVPPPKPVVSNKGKAVSAIAAMIAATLSMEGGYVNNKSDPGGETNMGVTKRVAVAHGYTGPMRTLPRGVATSIFYQDYLVAPGYLPLVEVDAPVTAELFDTSVNMGSPRPSRWFQQSIDEICGARLKVDGHVGAGTISAYRQCQGRLGATKLCVTMLNSLDAKQKAEYLRLIAANPKLKTFKNGWLKNRIGNVDRRTCATAGG